MTKYVILILILMICIGFMTGCQVVDTSHSDEVNAPADSTAANDPPSEETENGATEPENMPSLSNAPSAVSNSKPEAIDTPNISISRMKWASIREAIRSYGSLPWEKNTFNISAYDACVSQSYRYAWFPDGSEEVEDYEERWHLVFSDSVWAPGSTCVGIAVHFNVAFPDWGDETISVASVEKVLNDGTTWIGPDRTGIPYYSIPNDIGVLKVFTNQDGTKLLTDKPILLQEEDRELTPPTHKDRVNPAISRNGPLWSGINTFTERLKKPQTEIMPDSDKITILDGRYGPEYSYIGSEATYQFDTDNNCDLISIPADELFQYLRHGDMDGETFVKEMDLCVTWGYSDGVGQYLYHYAFEDCMVMILSNGESRNITKDSVVIVKE
jgi:hypothetical protein